MCWGPPGREGAQVKELVVSKEINDALVAESVLCFDTLILDLGRKGHLVRLTERFGWEMMQGRETKSWEVEETSAQPTPTKNNRRAASGEWGRRSEPRQVLLLTSHFPKGT